MRSGSSARAATVQGVLFDLDGTLVDNMELHGEAFQVFARRHGLPPLDDAMRQRIDGKRNRDIFPILFGRELPPDTVRAHTLEKESLYRDLSRQRLAPLAGLLDFLDRLKRFGLPHAIATSAPPDNVVHSLQETGLTGAFETIVRSDQVPRGKPHPDVFLEAARQIGTPPERCLVFEDAPAGIEAALAAGMTCAALTTSFHRPILETLARPHFFIQNYTEVLAAPAHFGLP